MSVQPLPLPSEPFGPREPTPEADPVTRIKLSSPAEILAAVPYLLGFTPRESLVVICLSRKQVGLTMRLDIADARGMRDAIVSRLHRDGADSAVLVLFDPEDDPKRPRPGTELMRSFRRSLKAGGIGVKDALGVHEGRYWSYLCTDRSCCPKQGRAVPIAGTAAHSKVAAPFVANGAAPLSSRLALVSSIATITGSARAELDAAYAIAIENPASFPVEWWSGAVRRYALDAPSGGRSLPLEQAVQLIVALGDVRVRDEILGWAAGGSGSGVLDVLRELAPLAVPPFDTQVLVSLAWAAFAFGDGALASVALERALEADPEHVLAGLLARALEGGITPSHIQEISVVMGGLMDGMG